jgi:hypothetical protein
VPVVPGNLPGGGTHLPPISSPPIHEDFSSTISKVGDILSDVSVSITAMSLDNANGKLDFVSKIVVSITGSTSETPNAILASYVKSASATSPIVFDVMMNSTDLYRYMSAGPVTIDFQLVGGDLTSEQYQSLHGEISTSLNLCLDVSASGSKSL